jgi:hypothetical protein
MPDRELELPHTLYRLRDAAGQLLYVGVTNNLGHRMKQHRRVQTWWGNVATIEAEIHPNRQAVLAAEDAAILAENPRWNVVRPNLRARGAPSSSPWEDDPLDLARILGVRTNLTHSPSELGDTWVHFPRDLSDPRTRRNVIAQIRRVARFGGRKKHDGSLPAPSPEGLRPVQAAQDAGSRSRRP